MAREEQDFLRALTNKGQNILHLEKFGVDTADSVIQKWLNLKKKRLTNYQMRVLQNVFSSCSIPLFCKLAFLESTKWRSYFEKEQTFLKNTLESSIDFMFEKVENKFNPVLVKHAFSYITASKVLNIELMRTVKQTPLTNHSLEFLRVRLRTSCH